VADDFHCDAPIGRQVLAAGTREVALGDSAATTFKVLQRLLDGTSLLEARPLTGRTNQIRLHCEFLGFPVVGDAAYGNEGLSPRQTLGVDEPPLCLHAWKLEFSHPVSGEAMSFTAAPPVWAS
jgi:23S rRNA-/tRNA-specific pseudouridylate synthase